MPMRDLPVAPPGLIGSVGPLPRSADLQSAAPMSLSQAAPTSIHGSLYGTMPVIDRAAQLLERKARAETPAQPGDNEPPAPGGDTPAPGDGTTPPDPAPGDDNSGTPDPTPGDDNSGTPETPVEEPAPVRDIPTGTPIPLEAGQAVTVMAGRVATLLPEDADTIRSVRILEGADWGHVSVNPDNSLALVLSGTDRQGALDFRYEITHADGRIEEATAQVNVVPGEQKAGWGLGHHYMLETDTAGNSVIEHGDNHRKVHVTASAEALSLDDIARIEGIQVSQIDGKWLADHPKYGGSADMALDQKAGLMLWHEIAGPRAEPSSHWLLLERGYTYDSLTWLTLATRGESALHPVLISAYGEGEQPILTEYQLYRSTDNANIVIRDLAFANGLELLGGKNYILEDLSITRSGLTAQFVDGVTVRDSDIIDVYRNESLTPDYWQPMANRVAGFYAHEIDGLLVENNFVDHTGWAENYRPDLSTAGGQPPSIYSHNMYINYENSDVTVRDNILMRGSSFGAQIRSGGMIEDNLFLDNNAAVNFLGGFDEGSRGTGSYTLLQGNVITSGAHRITTAGNQGALTMAIESAGRMSTLIDNIITHLADPNNPAELAKKPITHNPFLDKYGTLYNDTIIHNWVGANNPGHARREEGTAGLDKAVLGETTIQNFTAQLLGKETATIADLATYLRAQAAGKLDGHVDADIINAFFREGFGLDTTLRAEAQTLRFIPNDLADGIRWDNRLNWSTGDLPGTQDDDSVDLGGNHVQFGGRTVSVDHFDFGDFGRLTATSGKLTVAGEMAAGPRGASLEIDRAGQVWIAGYEDNAPLDIDVAGGRFANTGAMSGRLDMAVSGDGQAILASAGGRLELDAQDSLTLVGGKAKVGFDGNTAGTAALVLGDAAQLSFVADATGLSKIAEFRSGAFGDAPAVRSGVTLDGRLQIDLTQAGPRDTSWTLVQADEILGQFDGVQIDGLGRKDALLRIDYDRDIVTLAVSAEGTGTGKVRTVTAGEADFRVPGDASLDSLWDEMQMTY